MKPAVDELSPYQLFILTISFWTICVLAAGAFCPLSESTLLILGYADTALCGIFFLDFLGSVYRAPSRTRYLLTWGWVDLLSSIPVLDSLRWGRAARLFRILRVLRAIKSARTVAHYVAGRRSESAFLASVLLCLLLVVVGSIAILEFELKAGGNILTAQDAMWWAMSTLTTVGYGDRYPVTTEGRLVAVLLMSAGVGVFGTFSGLAATWFLSGTAREASADREQLKQLLLELRYHVVQPPTVPPKRRWRPDDQTEVVAGSTRSQCAISGPCRTA
jgi:voltage-gated potassium channel